MLEIAERLDLRQPQASEHLRVLVDRRPGRTFPVARAALPRGCGPSWLREPPTGSAGSRCCATPVRRPRPLRAQPQRGSPHRRARPPVPDRAHHAGPDRRGVAGLDRHGAVRRVVRPRPLHGPRVRSRPAPRVPSGWCCRLRTGRRTPSRASTSRRRPAPDLVRRAPACRGRLPAVRADVTGTFDETADESTGFTSSAAVLSTGPDAASNPASGSSPLAEDLAGSTAARRSLTRPSIREEQAPPP